MIQRQIKTYLAKEEAGRSDLEVPEAPVSEEQCPPKGSLLRHAAADWRRLRRL